METLVKNQLNAVAELEISYRPTVVASGIVNPLGNLSPLKRHYYPSTALAFSFYLC